MNRFILFKTRYKTPTTNLESDFKESVNNFYNGIKHNLFYPVAIYDTDDGRLYVKASEWSCEASPQGWSQYLFNFYKIHLVVTEIVSVDWVELYNELNQRVE